MGIRYLRNQGSPLEPRQLSGEVLGQKRKRRRLLLDEERTGATSLGEDDHGTEKNHFRRCEVDVCIDP